MQILKTSLGLLEMYVDSCIFNCYLQYFILFYRYVDFINVMAYDYSGPWSDKTGFMAPLYSRSSDIRFDQTLSQVDNFNTVYLFIYFTSNGCIVKICFYVYIIQQIILKIDQLLKSNIHEDCMIPKVEEEYTPLYLEYILVLSFKTKI